MLSGLKFGDMYRVAENKQLIGRSLSYSIKGFIISISFGSQQSISTSRHIVLAVFQSKTRQCFLQSKFISNDILTKKAKTIRADNRGPTQTQLSWCHRKIAIHQYMKCPTLCMMETVSNHFFSRSWNVCGWCCCLLRVCGTELIVLLVGWSVVHWCIGGIVPRPLALSVLSVVWSTHRVEPVMRRHQVKTWPII